MQNEFDLLVIGAGSGGVRAARWAANLGARVAIVEERFLGGTCVNVGCVPKKMFAYGAELNRIAPLATTYGICVEPHLDWAQLRDNKTREIERLNGVYRRLLLEAGVTLLEGHGQVVAPGKVVVNGAQYSARYLLVATGGKAWRPDIASVEKALISDDLFYLPELPKRAVVVGGGYIACEFASILHGLGVSVTQVYRGTLILRGFDEDVRRFVAEQMQAAGIDLRLRTDVRAILDDGVRLADGSVLPADKVFLATGRHANLTDLFAEGMRPALTANGFIQVDARFATSVPDVFAIGDVVGRLPLTPVALAEGMWLANELFGQKNPSPMDYTNIPTAVFCEPNVATVGMTEAEAKRLHGKLRIYTSNFRPLRYTLGGVNRRTLMKLVVDDATDRVVGAHMAGDTAAEIVQGLAIAVKAGLTKADFDRTLGIHPTSAEEWVTLRQGRVVE